MEHVWVFFLLPSEMIYHVSSGWFFVHRHIQIVHVHVVHSNPGKFVFRVEVCNDTKGLVSLRPKLIKKATHWLKKKHRKYQIVFLPFDKPNEIKQSVQSKILYFFIDCERQYTIVYIILHRYIMKVALCSSLPFKIYIYKKKKIVSKFPTHIAYKQSQFLNNKIMFAVWTSAHIKWSDLKPR